VKADIPEIRSDVERRMVSGEFIDSECGVEFLQKGIDLGVIHESSPKLEGIAHVPRQNLH
jgi:hypothetical protein